LSLLPKDAKPIGEAFHSPDPIPNEIAFNLSELLVVRFDGKVAELWYVPMEKAFICPQWVAERLHRLAKRGVKTVKISRPLMTNKNGQPYKGFKIEVVQ